jgi:hypothetical protein
VKLLEEARADPGNEKQMTVGGLRLAIVVSIVDALEEVFLAVRVRPGPRRNRRAGSSFRRGRDLHPAVTLRQHLRVLPSPSHNDSINRVGRTAELQLAGCGHPSQAIPARTYSFRC